MSFTLLIHPKAKKFLDKLDANLKDRIRKKASELREFPEKRGKPLKYSNFWGLRIGDYRVIYEINKPDKKVVILFVGHRKNVYDEFSRLF